MQDKLFKYFGQFNGNNEKIKANKQQISQETEKSVEFNLKIVVNSETIQAKKITKIQEDSIADNI
jgi:hypothetical protein